MNSSILQCTEGIILHMVPYRNYDQILTVFTPNQGVLKLFCKKEGGKSQRYTPLTKVEFIYRERKSELYGCEGITLIESYLNLRTQFTHLQTGCELIRSIYISQFVGKDSPLLYQLLIFYLNKIPHVRDPLVLELSFKLKILKHEGLISWDVHSFQVKNFDGDELELLYVLAHCQSFQQLSELTIPNAFKAKVEHLFEACIQDH